ncbi:DDE-type integrase/transposase/recombinase [Streptomyces sp. SID13031]|uniref:DDE-type integrase/transposase/recombinase n=1 Tax=Streptomyces sp. SID13031 TaxID=2706046 RepID=UPI0013C7CFEE|nr:DDE-type integrase/transposase/recombinase [Streptomyces sp. SID13031]NEA33739.1 transposase family protein [Streptomyces sp. SID13031]
MTPRPSPGQVLRVGDRVQYDGRELAVIGLSATMVRLRDDAGREEVIAASQLQSGPGFAVVGARPVARLQGLGLLAHVPAEPLAAARWWEQHLVEVETGTPPAGPASAPQPQYDPDRTSVQQREQAKLEELAAAGMVVSLRTLKRRRSAYARSGLLGLVDQRAIRDTTPTGRADPRLVNAIRVALREQTAISSGTRSRLRRRVEALLVQEHGAGVVPLPSQATFYRLVAVLDDGGHAFGSAATRRSLANRPDGPFGSVTALRPGELVQIDTTPLDVMALLDEGVPARVELTLLVDVATRSICSGLLRPHGTKAVDAALLLARALVPEQLRPGWPEALRMKASRLPHADLGAVDNRLAEAAAKPVITPETIVCDRGAVFLSQTFTAACARLGISLQPAHPRTPTDKGIVERTFSSINTLFCQFVAGYTGRDVTRRGADVDAATVWSLAELQDLFDQWVLAGWQPRPHDGLRHPELPRSALSPNEMYSVLVASAGYLPLALTGDDYLELLPVCWRKITATGLRIGSLTYDSAGLNPLRGQLSGHTAHRGQWPIHHDPYDLSQVWLRTPDASWIEIPWIHRARVLEPFADFTLRQVRKTLSERNSGEHDELEVSAALTALLSRAGDGPGDTSPAGKTGRRAAAKTRAAAAETATQRRPGSQLRTDDPPDDEIVDDSPEPAVVVPFGLFDAHAEARRIW